MNVFFSIYFTKEICVTFLKTSICRFFYFFTDSTNLFFTQEIFVRISLKRIFILFLSFIEAEMKKVS